MVEGPAIVAAVDDLFFLTKIETTARQVGVRVVEARNARMLEERLAEATPRLVLLDLNSKACVPMEAIRRIKSDPRLAATRVIGFLSHVQVELEQAAREAGCDLVLPRSKFSAQLGDILGSG